MVSSQGKCFKVFFIGPNPEDTSRNGGVAKYVEYFSRIPFESEAIIYYGFTDLKTFTKLGFLRLGRFFATVLCALKVLFNPQYDVVHINATLSRAGVFRIIPVLIAAGLRRRPVLLQIHGGRWSNVQTSRMSRVAWLLGFRLVSEIGLFPGPQMKELEKLSSVAPKLNPLRNFVEKAEPVPQQDESTTFLFLGRLVPEKGINEVISAFQKLKNEGHSSASLVVLGSGPSLNSIEKLSAIGVDAPGFVSGRELEEYLGRCNVFLLPSYHPEGFPLSFLEVAARGIVPVITENSAIPCFFKEGDEYLAVEPKDVSGLYRAMKRLVNHPEKRIALAKRIRAHVQCEFLVDSPGVRRQFIDSYCRIDGVRSE